MESQRMGESQRTADDDAKPPVVHRMNICIEVPAIVAEGIDPKASLVSFPDMINYIQALAERTKEDAKGQIANARFSYSTEWAVFPELADAGG